MAGPALQLFPPPPRPPRQTSPGRKLRAKTPTPEPERMDSAKSTKPPADFHELVIQVNSLPVSPSSSMAPPSTTVASPPRAHIPVPHITQTPPTASRPTFESPRPRQPSPVLDRRPSPGAHDPRMQSPSVYSVNDGTEWGRSPTASPDPARAVSPAFSTDATLVRANSSATQLRNRSPTPREEIPMRSMFPVFDPTKHLTQQAYKPTQASPTHIPKTQISRSPYSPDLYIPHNKVANDGSMSPPPKPFFTPSHLLDNLWVAANGQEDPAVQIYTLRMHRATAANPTITFGTTPSLPFYSLAQSNLAGGHEIPSIMNELLIQRHHPTQPRVLPISHLELVTPPSMDRNAFDPHQQEPVSLLTSIFPKLAALQALDVAANSPAVGHIALADPGATSPAAQRLAEDVLAGAAERECCALTWSRDNPNVQTNPWAQHLPSEGSYQLHHPTLGTFPIQIEGDCSVINKPSTRPVTAIYGHNMPATSQQPQQKPASITLLNPYILSPSSPGANAFSPLQPPPRIDSVNQDSRPISITPSEMSVTQLPTTTDADPSDAMLARLDFTNDALTLNLGALTRFGNPFLVDVAASALLAVAVAEAVRGRSSRHASRENFEPPPPSVALGPKKESDAKAFQEAFKDGFNSFGGKTSVKDPAKSLRKWHGSMKGSPSTTRSESFDKDIELGEWYGQGKTKDTKVEKGKKGKSKKGKEDEEEEKLPFVTRTIISVLTLSFKTVVFVLRIAIKVVAGVVVMITRNFSKL
ncbi:hypothetical protein K458DRAFT_415747 [Lentithecium fluviatile CBS 122367]|uniref:Uncharacterized protein n=1 Tax=Lentithecium fluviatile CBS 122367 TaxID=1168545 RepID=A0A6G1JAG3_9PLEO|nr:hypothetical protein K458DRAFT_415747 [Lentithecium fluviatile CBS 122367]